MVNNLKIISSKHFRQMICTIIISVIALILILIPKTRIGAVIALFSLLLTLFSRKVRQYIKSKFLVIQIEKELLNAGIYLKEIPSNLDNQRIFVRLPKVKISIDKDDNIRQVAITLSPYCADRLEKLDLSPIFDGYIQADTQRNEDSSKQIYRLLNISSQYYYQFDSLKQLFDFRKNQPKNTIPIDKYSKLHLFTHKMIVGQTGAGKSYFLLYLITYLRFTNRAKLYIADIKQSDVYIVARDHLKVRAECKKEEILNMTEQVYLELMKRQQEFDDYEGDKLGKTMPQLDYVPIFLVIDEQAALTFAFDKNELIQFNYYLKQIMLLGRQLGVFVIVGLQQYNAKNFGCSSEFKEQFAEQILLGNNDNQTIQNLFGATDLTKAKLEKGGGFYKSPDSTNPQLIRTPFLTPSFFSSYTRINLKPQSD